MLHGDATITPRHQPQFGVACAGQAYIDRPGVYALVLRGEEILVIDTPVGYYLPGGGVDGDELPERALARELLEETGLDMAGADLNEIGTACQYVVEAETGLGFNKIETFYSVHIMEAQAGHARLELDHVPRWVPLEDAITGLREDAQVWAVRRATGAS